MSSPPLNLLPSDPDWTLLGRFFRGECSAEEAETLSRWVAATPAHATLLAFMRRVWDEAAVDIPDVDEERGWRVIQARIAATPTRPAEASVHSLYPQPAPVLARPSRRGWRRRSMAAAAAIVIAIGGWMGWRLMDTGVSEGRAAVREYVTTPGQRADLMLDDGTRVWLNVGSRLRVPAGYGGAAREVELDGEAYFAVRHDVSRPFRVRIHGTVTEDLGTEFDVRAYADDPAVAVTVVTGRVVVRTDAASVKAGTVLGRGQTARVDAAGRVAVTDDADIAGVGGWRDGQLVFREQPLAEALREVGRWYDLEIILDDPSLARVPLTAVLSRRTGDQALAIIAGVLDTKYIRHGRRVHFGMNSAKS